MQYLGTDSSGAYHTLEAPIARQLFGVIGVLIAVELLVTLLVSRYRVDGILAVSMPTFLLLTVGCIYQAFVSPPSLSLKHYHTVYVGFFAMILGVILAQCGALFPERNRSKALRGLLDTAAIFTSISTIYGFIFRVNGSGAYFLNITPGEFYKVFVLAFLAIALVPMQQDKALRRRFLLLMLLMSISLIVLRSLGDAAVLTVIALLIVLQCTGIKAFLVAAAATAGTALAGYRLMAAIHPNNYLVNRLTDTFTAATDPSANANLRRALLGILLRGLGGSGTGDTRYVTVNFAVETDYVFAGTIAIFGVCLSLLVVTAFICLGLGLRMRAHSCQDSALYSFSTLVAILLMLQAVIHISCNLNLLPFTGICFPFLSRGGSNMCASMMAIGLAVGRRINAEERIWGALARPFAALFAKTDDLCNRVACFVTSLLHNRKEIDP